MIRRFWIIPVNGIHRVQIFDSSLQNKTKNMKTIFTFLLIIIFWLNAIPGASESRTQKQKEATKQKTAVAGNTNTIQNDSLSGYSINVNGQQNSVRIITDSLAGKSPETNAIPKINSNSVEISGEGNSVSVSSDNKKSKVNISQNGNNNQISITQHRQ